jgi:putative oxidoreductase
MFFFKTNDSWGGLILRVVLGSVIFAHGAQKLLGWFGGLSLQAGVGPMRESSWSIVTVQKG